MKISELVDMLNAIMERKGDVDINIITDGKLYDGIELDYSNNKSELYIEGYEAIPLF